MDEYSRIRQATIGSTSASWAYDGNNMLSQIAATGVQRYDYSFNVNTGNLNSRGNFLKSKTESFGYDPNNLDRLATVTGPVNQSIGYTTNKNGNILNKSDAGTYVYDDTPYAVSDITNALNISTIPQTINYYSFEKVKDITEGTKTAEFVYNAEQQRIRMTLKTSGATTKTRWYFGSSCEREQVGSTVTQTIWIGGDAYTAVAVAKKVGTGNWTVYNIFRDHLGTITHLKNGSNPADEYSFDACSVKLAFCFSSFTKSLVELIPRSEADREGRRRDKDTWSYTLDSEPALFADRGFTSHEYLDDFKLYNMNGRLYDPVVGRFLNPDPYVQDPGFTQNYNRYSYCLNNPLKYTDPSGQWRSGGIAEYFASGAFMHSNMHTDGPGGFGGSGSGGSVYGGPGYGDNGTGLNGVYYDWYSGAYRSTGQGNHEVGWGYAYSVASQYGISLPSNTNLGSIHLGSNNGISGVWFLQHAYAGFGNSLEYKESMWRFATAANGGGGPNWLYGTGVALNMLGHAATGGEMFLNGSVSFFNSMNNYSAPVGLNYSKEISLLSNSAKTIRMIGGATIVVGGLLDFSYGVPNYYKYGPNDSRSVSPGKAGLNLGMGAYSFYLNPLAGPIYFGVDFFYPGGWTGAINDQDGLIQKNQRILGPRWNMYKDMGGY